jgi:hypothetical protein
MLSCQKALFTLPDHVHYLNCAYMAPLARPVEAAGITGIQRKSLPSTIIPAMFFEESDVIRERFARLVNGEASRVALIPAASYGIATVARNLPVQRGQNLVMLHEQFPSNVYSWHRLAEETGPTLRAVGPSSTAERGIRWKEPILDAIDADTALVTLSPVHWADGTRFDLDRIGARAREVGAAFVVDGTQSVGALPFDVQQVRPDALICAGYKWLLGPYSTGVAYFGPRFDDGVPLEENWITRLGTKRLCNAIAQVCCQLKVEASAQADSKRDARSASFQDEIPRIIRALPVPMMLQILIDNLLGDLAGTPGPVADAPEVPAPVALLQRRVFGQELAGTATFDPAYDLADGMFGWIRDMQMHMIGADDAFDDLHVERVADLANEVSAAFLDFAAEHTVAIFGAEYEMHLQKKDAMAALSLLHAENLQTDTLQVSC